MVAYEREFLKRQETSQQEVFEWSGFPVQFIYLLNLSTELKPSDFPFTSYTHRKTLMTVFLQASKLRVAHISRFTKCSQPKSLKVLIYSRLLINSPMLYLTSLQHKERNTQSGRRGDPRRHSASL